MKAVLVPYARRLKSLVQRAEMRLLPRATLYPNRLVFVAGLPKAGTTWLENLIDAVPGYRRLASYDPNDQLTQHILDPVLLECLPSHGNFYIKTHVEARSEGVEALRRHRIPTVVLVRDLRDQCVSRFYHILSEPSHRHYDLYKSESADAFSHCVDHTINEYAAWIRGWLEAISLDTELFLLVRYEDMHADVKSELLRVLGHFRISLPHDTVDEMIKTVAMRARQGADLAERFKQKRNTFRAGRVGDWRTHFAASDVARFKANANDVLVSLGYEEDDKWLQPAN